MNMPQVPGLNTPQLDDRQLLHLGGHEGDDDEDYNDNEDHLDVDDDSDNITLSTPPGISDPDFVAR